MSSIGSSLVNSLLAALLASALIFIQCYISGTRLAFSLPAYTLIAIAGLLAWFAPRERASTTPSRWCLGMTAAAFGYLLTRAFLSPVEYLARADIYVMIAALTVYGLTAWQITEQTPRVAILTSLFLLTAVEVVIGTRQFMYEDNWMPFGLLRGGPSMGSRASGTFNSSIHLAGFLEIVAPFALACTFWGSRKLWIRLIAGYLAAVCYFGIGITGSRGGWISTLFSLLVFLVLSLDLIRRVHRRWFAPALYLSVIAVLTLPVGAYYLLKQDSMLESRVELLGKVTSRQLDDIRIHNWNAALQQWKESPVIGTGAGTHLYYGRKHRHQDLQADPVHAHSDYLELLAEYGAIGAGLIGLVLVVHLVSGLKGYRQLARARADNPYRSSPELALNLGALCSFSAYFAHSAVDFNLHLPGNALVFAFIFGLLAHPAKPPSHQQDHEPENDPYAPPRKSPRWPIPLRLVLPGLGAWMLTLGTPKIPTESLAEKVRVTVRDGYYHDAIALGERALQREKQNPYLYYYLGQAYRIRALQAPVSARAIDLTAAEQAYRAGLALFPQDTFLWVRLGQTLDELSRHGEARSAYEEAIRLDPKHGLLYAFLAKHFKRVGNPQLEHEALIRGQTFVVFDLALYFAGALHDPNGAPIPEEELLK